MTRHEAGHVARSSATSLGSWLAALGLDVGPVVGPDPSTGAAPSAASALLSFVVRARADRPESLDETLLSLAAQTETDFEVVVLAPEQELAGVRDQLAEHPDSLRDRLVLVAADGSDAEVLNAGVAAASGTYVCLSDDVTWFAQWVERVRECSTLLPGRCVRGVVLEQDVTVVQVGGEPGLRATAAPVSDPAKRFTLRSHVVRPLASVRGLAFPRSLAVDLGVVFDDAFGGSAVRRHLLRAVELAGVAEADEIVALHRRDADAEALESDGDLARLVEAIDSLPWLSPVGTASAVAAPDPSLEQALRSTQDEATRQAELLRLKDDHIENLEAKLAHGEATESRLRARVEKQAAQVERLRKRLGKAASAVAEPDATTGPADDADRDSGRRWFRRQP